MLLTWGLSKAIPASVQTAWGARWIFPDDIVTDRQDFAAENEYEKAKLKNWLNGVLSEARRVAKYSFGVSAIKENQASDVILFSDEEGVVVANTNASYGYLYVAAWLHEGDSSKQPAAHMVKLALPNVREYRNVKGTFR